MTTDPTHPASPPSGPPRWADLNAPLILVVALAGAIALVDVVLLVYAYYNHATSAIETQRVVNAPNFDLERNRSEQFGRLNSYGINAGTEPTYRIPIDEAIRLYAHEQAAAAATRPQEGNTP